MDDFCELGPKIIQSNILSYSSTNVNLVRLLRPSVIMAEKPYAIFSDGESMCLVIFSICGIFYG